MNIKVERKVATSLIAYLSSFFAFIEIVLAVICLWNVYKNNIGKVLMFASFALVIIFLIMEYWSKHYAWVVASRVDYKNGKLYYTYNEVFNMLGNNKNTYEIKKVEKLRLTHGGRHLKIKGDISFKGAYQKRRDVNKCVIYEVNSEVLKYIEQKIDVVIN